VQLPSRNPTAKRNRAFKRLALGNAACEALLLEYTGLNLDHIELAGVQRSIIGYDPRERRACMYLRPSPFLAGSSACCDLTAPCHNQSVLCISAFAMVALANLNNRKYILFPPSRNALSMQS